MSRLPLASWGRRAAAWLLDGLIAFSAFLVLGFVAVVTEPEDELGVASVLALGLVLVGYPLYHWLFVGARDSTPGGMAVGVRVRRAADGSRTGYGRALARAVAVYLFGIFGLPLLFSYLWPLWDERNQTLHDKIAGTIVVRDV